MSMTAIMTELAGGLASRSLLCLLAGELLLSREEWLVLGAESPSSCTPGWQSALRDLLLPRHTCKVNGDGVEPVP